MTRRTAPVGEDSIVPRSNIIRNKASALLSLTLPNKLQTSQFDRNISLTILNVGCLQNDSNSHWSTRQIPDVGQKRKLRWFGHVLFKFF